jgi:hypothetical protein
MVWIGATMLDHEIPVHVFELSTGTSVELPAMLTVQFIDGERVQRLGKQVISADEYDELLDLLKRHTAEPQTLCIRTNEFGHIIVSAKADSHESA